MPGPLSASENLAGFPQSWGAQVVSIIDHPGPASYTQLATGTPPTGGDTVTAAEAGMKYLQAVIPVGLSDNGANFVFSTPGVGKQGEVTSFFLEWFVAATAAQVAGAVNLSARTVRLLCIGR